MERCPVCRARLKQDPRCYRCGADLVEPLNIEEQALDWEQRAVTLLKEKDWVAARQAAEQALSLKRSPLAVALLAFSKRALMADQSRLLERLMS